jgi:hypothetical protein
VDPSLAVWVTDSDPSIAPGLPALLGERARVDPTGTIYFKIGPLDTDWALTPGGGGVPSAPSNATYWVSTANATLTAEVNMGALASGIVYQTVALGVSTPAIVTIGTGLTFTGGTLSSPGIAAQFWTSTATADLANEVDMGALGNGVLRQVTAVGVSTPSVFSHTATRIPFGSGTNGWLTDSGNFTYDDATGTLLVGLTAASAVVGVTMEVFRNQNQGTQFVFANSSAGASAYSAFQLGQSSNLATGATFGMVMYGSGSTFLNPILASTGSVELSGGSSNMSFWIIQAAGDFVWHTGTAYPNVTPKMKLSNAGTFTAYADAVVGLSLDVGTSITGGTTIKVGNAGAFPAGAFAQFNLNTNGPAYTIISNANAGNAAEAGLFLSQSATSYTNYLQLGMLGTGYTTIGPFQASGAAFEHVTDTTAPMFFSAYGGQAIDFYTTTSRTLRLRIENDGDIVIPDLSAGGVVYATAATGLLKIGSAAEVAAAITWPASPRVLISSGATTAPTSQPGFQYDIANDILELSDGQNWAQYNLGSLSGADYERVRAFWSGNAWGLTSEKDGTGTIRAIVITSTATTGGPGNTGGVTLDDHVSVNGFAAAANDAFGVAPNTNTARDHVKFYVGGGASQDTPSNSLFLVSPNGTAITTSHNSGILSTVRINSLTYTGSGSPTPSAAATLYIPDQPVFSGATGDLYAIFVDGGLSRFDGDGTHVFELPEDTNVPESFTIDRQVPVKVNGSTYYLFLYSPA